MQPHSQVLLVDQSPELGTAIEYSDLALAVHLEVPVDPGDGVISHDHVVVVQSPDLYFLVVVRNLHENDVVLVLVGRIEIAQTDERLFAFHEGEQVVADPSLEDCLRKGLFTNLAEQFFDVEHLGLLLILLEPGEFAFQPALQAGDMLISARTPAFAQRNQWVVGFIVRLQTVPACLLILCFLDIRI